MQLSNLFLQTFTSIFVVKCRMKLISITLESVTRISVSIFDQSVEGNNFDLQTCMSMIMVSTNVHAWNL